MSAPHNNLADWHHKLAQRVDRKAVYIPQSRIVKEKMLPVAVSYICANWSALSKLKLSDFPLQ